MVMVIKRLQRFRASKVVRGCIKAGASPLVARHALAEVRKIIRGKKKISSESIRKAVLGVLDKDDKGSAKRFRDYSARKRRGG